MSKNRTSSEKKKNISKKLLAPHGILEIKSKLMIMPDIRLYWVANRVIRGANILFFDE